MFYSLGVKALWELKGNPSVFKPVTFIHMFWCVNDTYLPKVGTVDRISWQLQNSCYVILLIKVASTEG